MGLKVSKSVQVLRNVTIREPVTGTAFRDNPVKVMFEIMTNSTEDELYKSVFVAPLRVNFVSDEDFSRAMQLHNAEHRTYARQLLTKVIVGWPESKDSGLDDADGNPLPFSPEALADLLELPYAVVGLTKAYRETVEGKSGAKGN